MRSYMKHTCVLILLLALLGVLLAPDLTASADQPAAIETVSQLVVNDPVSLEVITKEITVQPAYNTPTPDTYHTTIADAGAELRAKMVNREMSIVIGLKWNSADQSLYGIPYHAPYRV